MDTFFNILLAILGIGLLVFVHEAGHFIAARLCGVDCYVFSLGYGPRLFGFERNGCDFRISLVPVGGYVRMAGDIGENDDAPQEGSLARKSPMQRIFVYSAGVLMNFIISFLIFPIVYFWGVPATRPVVGYVVAGSPAWHARLAPGSVIHSINGTRISSFEQIPIEVAVSSSPLTVEYDEPIPGRPGSFVRRIEQLKTDYNEDRGIPWLGIESAYKFVSVERPGGAAIQGLEVRVKDASAAHDAGVRSGDLLISADGRPVIPGRRLDFLDRPFEPGSAFHFRFAAGPGSPSRTTEELARLEAGVRVEPRPVAGSERILLGVSLESCIVRAIRDEPWIQKLGLRVGDAIERVNEIEILTAADLERAFLGSPTVHITIRRGSGWVEASAAIPPEAGESPGEFIAVSTASVGTKTTNNSGEIAEGFRVGVQPRSAAALAGLRPGDRILAVNGAPFSEWEILTRAAAASSGKPVMLSVERRERKGPPAVVKMEIAVVPAAVPVLDPGFAFVDDRALVKAQHPGEAFSLGFAASTRFIKQIIVFLKKIALGEVAANKNVAGPILLAATTYQFANEGFIQLLYFLAILSLNLALINLLPIPLLDGGNLFFVFIEAIKGSPVSARVIGSAQTIGIFLLIALMVWVTFHDVRRVFGVF